MKIFVSICSYRDPLLVFTLKSLIQSKSQLTEVTYGIFEQIERENSLEILHPELVSRSDVKYKRIDPQYSEGVGWARHINSLQMTDEDFYYQIDSHTLFDERWDRQLICDYKEACQLTGTNKIVITSNCKNFDMINGSPALEHNRNVACVAKFYQFDSDFWIFAHGEHTNPTLTVTPAIHVFAGNMFTNSDWIRDVGIDPKIYFHGEEQMITLSSFAEGYKLFHGKQICCYHYLNSNQHTSKQDVEPVISEDIIALRKAISLEYFKKFIRNLDDNLLNEYKSYSGVDYINRKLENRAITRAVKPSIENDWEIP